MSTLTLLPAVDLSLLPPATVIETLDFDTIYQEMLTQFRAMAPEYTLLLESDPVVKLIQAISYRELIWRSRLNEVAQSNLLATATGADLDNLGAFKDVARMVVTPANTTVTPNIPAVMESDDRYRVRIQLANRAISTAGSVYHYKYWAMSADARVVDAAVYSPDYDNGFNMGGQVIIALLSSETGGVASQDLITKVSEVVGRNDIRMLNDKLSIVPAAAIHFSVTAQIKLYPNISQDEIQNAINRLQTAFANAQGLGRDVTRAWLIGVMISSGIHSIEIISPTEDIIIAPNQYPVLDNVTTVSEGYADAEGYGVIQTDNDKALALANKLYVDYAIANSRTVAQIMDDLPYAPIPGVIQPTVQGLTEYLNLLGTHDVDTGEWLPEDELCFLIWRNLSPQYPE